MPDRTPNLRASYDAVERTPPCTPKAFPVSDGLSRICGIGEGWQSISQKQAKFGNNGIGSLDGREEQPNKVTECTSTLA